MKEELLHFIWKYKKLPLEGLLSASQETIQVIQTGRHNHLSGPDFFNAKLKIGGQLWAGNVEIHLKASDWYAHHHEKDAKYDNVILHVVWENDVSVFRKDNSEIPVLELKNYISTELLNRYQELFNRKNQQFIPCENEIKDIQEFTLKHWFERLFFERLEQKSNVILGLLETSKNDWEKVLFILLLKNFGSKINGELFFEMGKSLDFSIVRKLHGKPLQMEALFMGLSGLLISENSTDSYYTALKKEYKFLKKKFVLREIPSGPPEFFKLRPLNFPTIRLAQLAALYSGANNLFNLVVNAESEELKTIFSIHPNTYWEEHYTFGTVSKKSKKGLSKNFVDLLMINTVIPLRFCYQKYKGIFDEDIILSTIEAIPKENNSIVKRYEGLGISVRTAKESQSLLQLYNNYCTQNKCLDCTVGARLLNLKS
ncbi:DUF2851 family protein [Maribacter sp. 2210JD10-5]|uniref:DUF2851 family protein n=1 Tax=Maribacter sp. 2210JD10-5 TaxID=3386272 RepID=UPI0039BCFF57